MKHLKIFTCLLAATLFFASCDDDDDDNRLSFDKDTIDVFVGAEDPVVATVTNAEGKLTVTTDKKIVSAVVSEEDSKKIEFTGVAEGETTANVADEAGKTGDIKVTVLDPSTRFAWDATNVKGEETYTLVQDAETGKVTFTWIAEGNTLPIVLSFDDADKKLAEGTKKEAKLSINGKEIAVSALEIKYNRELEKDAAPTIWISFKADNKDGICVATVTANEAEK